VALNTKEIRQRIRGFKSTQQITKAMELVAAAKVRRVQQRAVAARPYAEKIREMFAAVTNQLPVGEVQTQLLTQREVKNVLLIVITSDKGLAGAYNSNVLRHAVGRVREWKEKGVEPQLLVVGTKGVNFFRHSNVKVVHTFQHLPPVPTFTEATLIVEEFTKLYTRWIGWSSSTRSSTRCCVTPPRSSRCFRPSARKRWRPAASTPSTSSSPPPRR
jgi:F-type H+-transporting ATPase subunit gamma